MLTDKSNNDFNTFNDLILRFNEIVNNRGKNTLTEDQMMVLKILGKRPEAAQDDREEFDPSKFMEDNNDEIKDNDVRESMRSVLAYLGENDRHFGEIQHKSPIPKIPRDNLARSHSLIPSTNLGKRPEKIFKETG